MSNLWKTKFYYCCPRAAFQALGKVIQQQSDPAGNAPWLGSLCKGLNSYGIVPTKWVHLYIYMCKRYISLSLDLDGRRVARRALAKKEDARCGGIVTRFAKRPASLLVRPARGLAILGKLCYTLLLLMVAVLTTLFFQRF